MLTQISLFRRLCIPALLLLFLSSCEDTNLVILTDAASDAVTAVTLTDEDVVNLASQAAVEADRQHTTAPPDSRYAQRLNKLVAQFHEMDGHRFNFKVYLTQEVNAFAMADGTIRVYSGLMDLMNDEELLFVIGHEMGHVVLQHSRKKVVMAYASSAVRKGLASQENELGQIARSVVGSFAQQLTNAQFSQHEEREADDYGVNFLLAEGYDSRGAVSALEKLAQLARQHTFLSSHPEPEERALRIARGDHLQGDDDSSLLSDLFSLVKTVASWLYSLVVAIVQWVLSFF